MTGGLTIRFDDAVILEVMPVKDGLVDVNELERILRPYAPEITRAYLEAASIRPMQAGQFKVGRNFGRVEATLEYLVISTTVVRPQDWSKHYDHGVTVQGKDKRYAAIKKARMKIAQSIYPGISFLATERSSVPHDGLVDSALLADYGWKNHKQMRGIR